MAKEKAKKNTDDLRPQHKVFAEYFIKCGNQTKAYRQAYPSCKSDGAAAVSANKLLNNVKIRQYIEQRSATVEKERIASADEVLEYLTRVVRGEEKDSFGLEVGVAEKTKAAELLGKRYALFRDKLEIKDDTGIADRLKRARERGDET